MQITLTQFLDFTVATGSGRLTQVRRALDQSDTPYDPATDYWRGLREGIREEFEQGWEGATSLDRLRSITTNERKQERYRECVNGLSRWVRRKHFGQSRSRPRRWTSGDLTVTVNPELVLDVNGVHTAVKLYFKAEPLSKPRIDTLLYLLHAEFARASQVGVLDVPRGRLISETIDIPALDVLLAGDASQFVTMWRLLEPGN